MNQARASRLNDFFNTIQDRQIFCGGNQQYAEWIFRTHSGTVSSALVRAGAVDEFDIDSAAGLDGYLGGADPDYVYDLLLNVIYLSVAREFVEAVHSLPKERVQRFGLHGL